MPLMPLNQRLSDLGGVNVLWDSDLGTLVQDPSEVPAGAPQHTYGPGDVFRDPNNGDLYQLQSDGSLTLYKVGTPPTVPAPTGDGTTSATAISSAGRSWTSGGAQNTGGAIAVQGNPGQWFNQAVNWLTNSNSPQTIIRGLPNGFLVGLGYAAYAMMGRRRRNPPILRNPGKGSRLARRAERARQRREQEYVGAYIREQRAAMRRPSEGRLGRFEQTYYLAQRRRRRR